VRIDGRTTHATRALIVLAIAAALTAGASAPASAQDPACPSAERFTYDPGGPPTAGGPIDDPLWPQLWGMRQINAPAAWSRGFSGRRVTVAVLDSGVDLHHPDLVDRLVPGVDMVEGWEGNCAPGPQDDLGHGTHVAGTIAATGDNGIGVVGVAPRARILPMKICLADGTCPDGILAEAIRDAADRGADVINMSLGASFTEYEPLGTADATALQEAVDHAWAKGAVLVAGAGNEREPACFTPAALRHVICVAATDRRGLPPQYSNLPFDLDALDGNLVAVRAPGGEITGQTSRSALLGLCDEAIWSTFWPGGIRVCGAAYDTWAGTSMATPHVSGVAALLAEAGLTNAQIVERIRATSSNRGRYDPIMGFGIVDAGAATEGLSVRRGRGTRAGRGLHPR
jgi:thermitase